MKIAAKIAAALLPLAGAAIEIAAFVAALACLAHGCAMVAPALGWIVPAAVVLAVMVAIKFIPGGKSNGAGDSD